MDGDKRMDEVLEVSAGKTPGYQNFISKVETIHAQSQIYHQL